MVATERGGIVEVQGTAEGAPIPRTDFDALLELGLGAMPTLAGAQRAAITEAGAVRIGYRALRALQQSTT